MGLADATDPPRSSPGSERGETADGDVERAVPILSRHRALDDTIERAPHYGKMAFGALALFPNGCMKSALLDAVAFCIGRRHQS